MFFPTLLMAALPVADDCPNSKPTDCPNARATQLVAHVEPTRDIVETALEAGNFNTLAAALRAGELVGALQGEGPFTVFAPTDAAFAALPEGTLESLLEPENKGLLQAILTYHVVAGAVPAEDVVELDFAATLNGQRVDIVTSREGVSIDGAKVTTTDIRCTNGIIHVIDTVLLPNTNDIVETAVEAGSFKTLAAALKAADLVGALQGEGPFTVFAPTDAAFAKLPAGTVESLLKPENLDQLKSILTFHVVPGRIYADQAVEAGKATTLQGQKLPIQVVDGKVKIGDSFVVSADIETTNGVIHVIDSVLLPQ